MESSTGAASDGPGITPSLATCAKVIGYSDCRQATAVGTGPVWNRLPMVEDRSLEPMERRSLVSSRHESVSTFMVRIYKSGSAVQDVTNIVRDKCQCHFQPWEVR